MAQPSKWKRSEPIDKRSTCSCGAPSKLIQRCNYPFGRKSTPKRSWHYICHSCGKTSLLQKAPSTRGRR